jgi:hypothetical protein
MGIFQIADAPIIRPGWVGLNDAGEDAAGMQQVRYGAKRCHTGGFTWRGGGVQVRPCGWDERAGPIGQNQDEVQLAVAPHPAKERQRLTFQGVPCSADRDFRRITLEVGSV